MRYSWPGNVRELENAIEYAFVTCKTDTIHPHHLPEHIVNGAMLYNIGRGPIMNENEEKSRIISALEMTNGNRLKASKILGYSRITLWKKMKKFGIMC